MASRAVIIGVGMSLPFVGRSRALRGVRELLTSGRGVVVSGPAGIGKTRLLQALVQRADPPVERIVATEATGSIPLGACMRFLPSSLVATDGVDALAAVRSALLELHTGGWALGVDDADHLDGLSAAVVADAVRAGLPVVLCSRTAAVLPAPLHALLDEGSVIELPLAPLPPADAAALVRGLVRGLTTTASLARVLDLGEGNPLLLTELASAAARVGLEQLPMTERLQAAVQDRVRALTPAARTVVDALAYDAPLPLTILAEVCGAAAVDEAERRGVVAAGPGPAHLMALSHPLVAEVRGERLTAVRRARLGAALVAAVGEGPLDLPDGTVRHARWQVDAGDITAPRVLRDAARELLARWDPTGATTLATIARRHLPDDPGPLLTLAAAAALEGDAEGADRWYAAVEDNPGSLPEQVVQAMLGRAEAAYFGRGDAEGALAVLDGGPADVPGADAPAAALRALIALCAGRYVEAEAAAAGVGADAPTDLRLMAAAVAHVAVASGGRLREAWALTEAALPLLEDPGVAPEHHFRFASGRQYLRLHLGELADMRRAAEVRTAAERLRRVASDTGLAYGELLSGCGDRARELLEDARARLGRTDPYGHGAFTGCVGAELATLRGLRAEARRSAAAAAAASRPHLGWWAWAAPAAAAWSEAAHRRLANGRALMREAADTAAGNGDLLHRCCCLLGLVRLGDVGAAVELATAAAPLDGRLWPAVATAASGLADPEDPEGCLEQGCAQLLDIGAVLWAVALLARGADLDRAARPDRAARRQTAAERHAMRLRDVLPIALQQLRGGPEARLTRRQREVAMLAAQGLTSREVADRLVVSVRTVDNHLAIAYQVLGVAGRTELAGALGVQPDDGS